MCVVHCMTEVPKKLRFVVCGCLHWLLCVMKDKLFRFCISALKALPISPQAPTAFLASVYLKESNFLADLMTPVHFSLLAQTNFALCDIDDL